MRKQRIIDVTKPLQLRNLAMAWHVTEEQIVAAVEKVGNVYSDVQRHLKAYTVPYLHRRAKI